MSLSNDRGRPKTVRFVDVSAEGRPPGWLTLRHDQPRPVGPAERVDRLVPPEVPSHERPPLAPVLESVRPPPPRPSQFPGGPTPYPGTVLPGYASGSQYPAGHFGSQYPSSIPGSPSQFPPAHEALDAHAHAPEPRADTMVEDLVPRAEEEAVAAIAAAVDRFQSERQQALASAEGELIELVRVICRRVLLAELQHNPLVIERLVHAGLEALAGGDKLAVRLGPFFSEALPAIRESLEQRGMNATVLIDPSVGPQGCQLSTELGRVDESVGARLEVLLSSLGLGS